MMNSKLNKMFDHIVIGAGASGCVLARRLIDGGKNVLLIEAGELHVNQSNVDNVEGFPNLWGSKFDWKYSTTPQKNLLNRVIDINQGKIVGGSKLVIQNEWLGKLKIEKPLQQLDLTRFNGSKSTKN